MTNQHLPQVLFVYPRFPDASFWNYRATCQLAGARHTAAPLSLITVAALLPAEWPCRLVDRNIEELEADDLAWADMVLTGGMLVQQRDTLRIVALAQSAGKVAVVGGPDATSSPEIYAAADFLVLGEADDLMRTFAEDWLNGVRKGTYRSVTFPDVTRTPVPRFDLLQLDAYLHIGIQFSRGCPFRCEFCDIIELYGRVPRVKTPGQVLAELDALYARGWRGHVDFVDDNLIGNGRAVKAFLPELRRWQQEHHFPFEFSTEASLNLADDAALLEMLKSAGFFAIFVGIESPDEDTLIHSQKKQNARREIVESVRKIHQAGMWVLAGFIIGFDTERESVAARMIRCIEECNIPVAMVGLLYALPGTQMTRRLASQGRLHANHGSLQSDDGGDQCTASLSFDTLRPPAEVLRDYRSVVDQAYTPANYFRRVRAVGRALALKDAPYRRSAGTLRRDLLFVLRLMFVTGVRDPACRVEFWRTLLDGLLHNPRALRAMCNMIGLYCHMGPFARRVSASFGAQIAEFEGRVEAK